MATGTPLIAAAPRAMAAEIDRRVFPADGQWTRTRAWIDAASAVLPDRPRRLAENALLRVFTPAWCRRRPRGAHRCHPFETAYDATDVRGLLTLGLALHRLGSPAVLVRYLADDRQPLKFYSVAAEAWGGALLQHLGGEPRFIDPKAVRASKPPWEKASPPVPEAIVDWLDGPVAYEHKYIRPGGSHGLERILLAISRGIEDVRTHRGEAIASTPQFELPDDEIRKIWNRARRLDDGTGRDVEEIERWAYEFGIGLAEEWLDALHPGLVPGQEICTDRVLAVVEEQDAVAPVRATRLLEPASLVFSSLSRKLNQAATQVRATGLPGVLVADTSEPEWQVELLESVVQAANDERDRRPWVAEFGALLLRTTLRGRGPGAWVIPVPRAWHRLPRQLRDAPVVPRMGLQFLPFDLLRLPPQDPESRL